ncbi:imelysin family protein [Terasakiella pusilla]|uniref:imelysin family protein n=1 Tax=Terasakiella pusilla TaxID=64973 RepID=UPI003AA9AEBE
MKRLFALSLLLLTPTISQAAPSTQELSLKVVQDFVIPSYDAFSHQAKRQADAWDKTCNGDTLKPLFHNTSDAWAAVQHINFGPITLLLRRDRLYHWPERRNAVGKSLSKALNDKDISLLSAKKITGTSVALQGLPALERILYTDAIKDDYGCQLGKAIAHNIEEIANGTLKDWKAALPNIKEGSAHPIFFESNDEVAIRLFTELLTGFQMISDQKIALPMGSNLKKANGKRAEGWRSLRSTRYIQQSAKNLRAMALPFVSFLPEKSAEKTEQQLSKFVQLASTLPSPLKDAVTDEEARKKILTFRDEISKTRNLIVEEFTQHLGLTVGFNSLDGD